MKLKINGVEVEAPIEMGVTIVDIDKESNRNANGKMIRNRIAVKRKISCKWGILTTTQIQTILKACSDSSFSLYYIDPKSGYRTITVYCGDRTAATLFNDRKYGGWRWKDLSIDFVEM